MPKNKLGANRRQAVAKLAVKPWQKRQIKLAVKSRVNRWAKPWQKRQIK
ncbi:MAG: hypothetical protein RR846_03185 [Oscillospiraceae bacterium]